MRTMMRRLSGAMACALALNACGGGGGGGGDQQEPPATTQHLSITLSGSGRITSTPAGIDCGTQCAADFAGGTSVTLTATPADGYRFDGYGGDCTGGSCTIRLDAARSVTATFTKIDSGGPGNPATQHQLSVALDGNGSVRSTPAGIDCGTQCAALFDNGTIITLSATPAAGYRFDGYSGDCKGAGCAVQLDDERSVTAHFSKLDDGGGTPPVEHQLSVTLDGSGHVRSTPAGIDCGTQCMAAFDAGTSVTLSASAADGYQFDGYSGACTGSSCTLGLDDDRSVVAHFSAVVVKACDEDANAPTQPLHHYRGLIHAHTSYSDGDIHALPHDVFKAGHDNHLDFAAATDHSDTLNDLLFLSVGSDCFNSLPGLLTCLTPSVDRLGKWAATQQQVDADRIDKTFTPIRGFEWTSDRFGHINVLFSSNFTNAKLDGGYIGTMDTFWQWLPRTPAAAAVAGITAIGGAADGIGIFNHPGDKCLSDDDPGCNWNGFAYVATADTQMVGIELFNSGTSGDRPDAGRHDHYPDFYMQALDAGWHVGAIGGEDMHDTTWALPSHPKTVVIATANDPASLKAAMQARRMYALLGLSGGEDLTITMDAEGHAMGSRLACGAGKTVPLHVVVSRNDGAPFDGIVRLYDHADGAAPLAAGIGAPLLSASGGTLDYTLPVPDKGERWYFVRVDNASGQPIAYSSPVWVRAR